MTTTYCTRDLKKVIPPAGLGNLRAEYEQQLGLSYCQVSLDDDH